MITILRSASVLFGLLSVLTGLVYPGAVAAVASWWFPAQTQGSLLREDDRVVGSSLIGQSFHDAGYFWGRPSATLPSAYNAAASSGSNLGPTNPALHDAVATRIADLRAADPGNLAPVPIDLVTASGSGLDPHVSPAAALYQVSRVARSRVLDDAVVRDLVMRQIESRTFGVLGEPRVNVLQLNLELDRITRSAN